VGIKSEEAWADTLSVASSPSHPVSAETNNATTTTESCKQIPAAPMQTEISKEQLIQLQSDQTSFSKYPVGCRVHYNYKFHAAPVISLSNAKFVYSVSVGVVKSVFMDLSSKSFVYELASLGNESKSHLLRESDLSFATGTPVNVQFPEGDTAYEGEITGCSLSSDQTRLYSVLLFTENNTAQIYDNVVGDMIRYRHDVEQDIAGDQNVAVHVSESTSRRPSGNNVQSDSETSVGLAVAPTSAHTGKTFKGQSPLLQDEQQNEKPPATMITTPASKRVASPCASSITIDGNKVGLTAERPSKMHKSAEKPQIGALTAERTAPHTSQSGTHTNERLASQTDTAFSPGKNNRSSRLDHPRLFENYFNAEQTQKTNETSSREMSSTYPVQVVPVPPNGPLIVKFPPWLINSSAIRKELFGKSLILLWLIFIFKSIKLLTCYFFDYQTTSLEKILAWQQVIDTRQ
jgi:hypothetical protein